MMDKCPECGRVTVAYDPVRCELRCLWNECRHVEATGALEGADTEPAESREAAPRTRGGEREQGYALGG
ncbi:MAG TPA: hypothetical protein VM537_10980 [Anaerolineae bacterium]|nr:hypothetical protein [Anaerolineae bacterium]